MRASILRALVLGVCTICVVGTAEGQQQPGQQSDWIVRGEALARRIEAGNLIITPDVKRQRDQTAQSLQGDARLMLLYDMAADDYVASDAEAATTSIARLEQEARVQSSVRYAAMAAILRAYAPALDGDYVTARSNLAAALILRAARQRRRSRLKKF